MSFDYYGNVITNVQKEKYLGVYITNDCCDDSSILAAMRGLYSRDTCYDKTLSNATIRLK